MKDPTHAEMYSFLETQACGAEDIRFDIEEAIYWFASDYHSGQWSNLYSVLCQSEYTPSQLSRVDASNSFFYDMLVAEYAS
jgi:hypothetical protein